jgi:hypothetical protein
LRSDLAAFYFFGFYGIGRLFTAYPVLFQLVLVVLAKDLKIPMGKEMATFKMKVYFFGIWEDGLSFIRGYS